MKLRFILIFLLASCMALADETAELMPKFDQSLYLDIESNGRLFVAVGERGHIAVSEDFGESWKQLENVPTRTTLTSVAIQNNNIWAVGHDTTVIHSKDAGKTWEVQFQDIDREMPLLDVIFQNESEGFAIGAYGTFLSTVDGGKNWNDGLISEEDDFHLNSIIQVDDFKYFVVAEGGSAYRSFDAGKTWESLTLPYDGSMFGAEAMLDQIIVYGLRGNVFVTNDFGDTFEQVLTPGTDSLFGSIIKSDNSVLLVGAKGAVYHYKNNNLVSVDKIKSDDDYTDLIAAKNNNFIFISDTGISTKKIR